MRSARLVAALLLGLGVPSLIAPSLAQAGTSCHKINAKSVGQDHGDGTTDANTVGGGLLNGATEAQFSPTGVDGSIVSIEGSVTFLVNRATLTVAVSGTLDVSTGAFTASGPVTAATGKLAGSTGTLEFDGVEDLSTGAFSQSIRGTICVDLSP